MRVVYLFRQRGVRPPHAGPASLTEIKINVHSPLGRRGKTKVLMLRTLPLERHFCYQRWLRNSSKVFTTGAPINVVFVQEKSSRLGYHGVIGKVNQR